MEAIAWGDADYAVLPIENSTAGVTQVCRLSGRVSSLSCGRADRPGRACADGASRHRTVRDPHRLFHPQGLWQCRKFLEQHPDWETVDFDNTATAARKVAQDQDKTQAAIASREAAERLRTFHSAGRDQLPVERCYPIYYCVEEEAFSGKCGKDQHLFRDSPSRAVLFTIFYPI